MNTQTALFSPHPFCPRAYHFTPGLIEVFSPPAVRKKTAGEGGRDEGGRFGPDGGSRGTDVGRLALGRGRELTNANYYAKLLAKYVSRRHIRLLGGRFMVIRNSDFSKGGGGT